MDVEFMKRLSLVSLCRHTLLTSHSTPIPPPHLPPGSQLFYRFQFFCTSVLVRTAHLVLAFVFSDLQLALVYHVFVTTFQLFRLSIAAP